MAVSPQATLRGSASVMAAALGARKSTDLIVQLCGDAHLSNFGIYASPERDLVFDVNDFDETHPGPFEWDVLRLATSFVTCLQSRDETDKATALARHIADTYRDTMQDLSKKPTVGVGSIGTRCFVTLLEGRDADDKIILQFKAATPSVLAPHVKNMGDFARIEHEGQRIVRGQKMMQAVSDLFLGWVDGMPGTNKQFFGRQLHDMKGGFDVETAKLATVELYADLCARTLARAHARSGDTVAIAAYLGDDKTFAEAVEVFAVAEAHFVAGDHKRLTDAIAAGELEAADIEDA